MDFSAANIQNLAEMLKVPGTEDSDSEDEIPKKLGAKLGPGDVGPKKEDKPSKSIYAKKETSKNSKEIWNAEDVQSGSQYEDTYDPRPQPDYDIVYKQAISSEDMFLQMGNKTPGTASCEDMVVKIKLPDAKIADVKLDCKDTFVDCRTPKYKLGLHLPHPVDSKNGTAKWDSDTHTLAVTLRMKRDYDFMNF